MFGSEVIDAAIGLFLVYFLFSLLCSATNELIIGHLASLRARTLEDAIKRMLIDAGTAEDFFKHPLIRGLCKNDSAKPSYISPRLSLTRSSPWWRAKPKQPNQLPQPLLLAMPFRPPV